MVGRKLGVETIRKISNALRGKVPKNAWKEGGLHPFWKKDRTLISALETKEYKKLRISVFKRDNYTCKICNNYGEEGTRIKLELHHIKPKKDYPELFWQIDNCMTVCRECHKKTKSYLNRWKRWEDFTGKKAEKVSLK